MFYNIGPRLGRACMCAWQIFLSAAKWASLNLFSDLLIDVMSGNTKGGRITVPLTSCLTVLD